MHTAGVALLLEEEMAAVVEVVAEDPALPAGIKNCMVIAFKK
jgi:hypothetical protein